MSRLMQGNKLEKVHPICKGFRISMKVLVEFWPKFALCCTEVPSFVGAGAGYGVIAHSFSLETRFIYTITTPE
ncbi:uncharacterized protein H6S33_002154 [Morchella sextelata]|uniref:uncharacterized protein n=1 Tax=Morchella sextelata TaxID=1174677 RepID=UPI001D04281C|nr:uncharacterized protein H6S33_002154 [Morchella sextelata]KAH0608102.1 hypothetical protein H6S33_002154 [Morchella sextelata]